MDDSIINIDDESDSFSLSSDTDIRNIVDQWKRNHTTDHKDSKIVDTRTFTRPKKRLFTFPEGNNTMTFAEHRERASSDELSDEASTSTAGTPGSVVPKIDLKIGGLVTSMQRSMLGDVTPPSHMSNSMENSLITSSDFTNVNDFINDNVTGDSLSMANFKEYRLSDAIKDRNFLERLTNYDESYFTKDADINNVDVNENGGDCTGSSSSTLQNSTDSSSCLGGGSNGSNNKLDGTFVAKEQANGTFNASGGIEVDKTFIQAPTSANTSSIKNCTFELAPATINRTFETQPIAETTIARVSHKMGNASPVISLEDEELSLCDSFNATKNLEYKKPEGIGNVSAQLVSVDREGSPQLDMNSTLKPYESTPAAHKMRKSRKSEALATISPIFPEANVGKTRPTNHNLTQNVDKFVDIEIDDISVLLRESSTRNTTARASNPSGIDLERREKERQSLAKFEEFENTLMILENNKSEAEFDDLLNSFSANIRNPMSEKVRQSLDNLKKRHSLIGSGGNGGGEGGGNGNSSGLEKQQQDELNREKSVKNGKYSEFGGAVEKMRSNDYIGRMNIGNGMISSTMSSSSSSGNGERLLRRSRLFDDINVMSIASENNDDGIEHMDNKHTAELNSTQTLNKKNQMHLECEVNAKTDQISNISNYNTEEIPTAAASGGKSSNRDRFKTIRIFKKPPENAIQIPDPDDEQCTPDSMQQIPQYPSSVRSGTDAFAMKNTNSPKHQSNELISAGEGDTNQYGVKKPAINTMTYKRSGLVRPRQLSGLAKRDPYMKSSSHELLSSDHETPTAATTKTTRQTQSKPVPQLKSPMGIKSKSIHNLSTAKITISKPSVRSGVEQSQPQPQSTTGRGQNLSSHTFKIPAPKSLVTMRQRRDIDQPQKLKLIRPSSGYFGYNSKRTDSDTDLGRFSSNNSLSSGSSKSSLGRGETPETFVSSTDNVNATFVQPPIKTTTNVPVSRQTLANGGGAVSGIVPPRVSMLRPPNQIRRSALPRPSAAATTSKR